MNVLTQAERDETDKGTKRMLMSNVECHVLCVEVGLDLGCHVVIGVVRLVARFHHADAIPKYRVLFLLDIVVQLCTCSQIVFCDRQFHL